MPYTGPMLIWVAGALALWLAGSLVLALLTGAVVRRADVMEPELRTAAPRERGPAALTSDGRACVPRPGSRGAPGLVEPRVPSDA
jgi:hypothetical protein